MPTSGRMPLYDGVNVRGQQKPNAAAGFSLGRINLQAFSLAFRNMSSVFPLRISVPSSTIFVLTELVLICCSGWPPTLGQSRISPSVS